MKWIHRISVTYFSIALAVLAVCAYLYFSGRDTEGPVIKMDKELIELDVSATNEDILAGVTAYDSKDGDVSNTLMVEYISNFIGDNQREVGIVAFDSDGHVSKAKRIAQYNYTGIKFSLSEPLRFPVGTNTKKIKQVLSAQDAFDGAVTRWIMMNNVGDIALDVSVAGEYPVEFSVSNSAGDVEKFTATVEMYNPAQEAVSPKITLKKYMVYVEQGEKFEPMKHIDTIVVDRDLYHMDIEEEAAVIRQLIRVDGEVDTSSPGWYEIGYSLEDSVNNEKNVHIIICVTEKED